MISSSLLSIFTMSISQFRFSTSIIYLLQFDKFSFSNDYLQVATQSLLNSLIYYCCIYSSLIRCFWQITLIQASQRFILSSKYRKRFLSLIYTLYFIILSIQQISMVRVIQEPDSHTANDFTNNSQLHRLHHDQQLLPRSQINDSVLYFEGDEKTFRFKFQELSIESQDLIKTALVTILGDQVKPSNFMCLFLTVITGILFIFPFFFCCCQWWKRVISQIFIISEQTYHQIGQLIQYKNLSSVELKLFDNCFNKRKAQLISKSVKKRHTQLISLKITNLAGAFDFLKSEYSKFQQNMESMKSISGTSVSLEWYTKKLEYQ